MKSLPVIRAGLEAAGLVDVTVALGGEGPDGIRAATVRARKPSQG